jgi:hypothetical protein
MKDAIYVGTISGKNIMNKVSCILNQSVERPHLWPWRRRDNTFVTRSNGGRWDQRWRVNVEIVR